jgi:hypothetical protein
MVYLAHHSFYLVVHNVSASRGFGAAWWRHIFTNLVLSVPMLIAGISGISAFFTGIIGILKSKERSVLVFIAVLIGFFILVFILGEFLFPH